jgi:hypothetical protein
VRAAQVANARTERLILSSLDSPWVVRLFFSFQTDDCLYLVLEYLNGGDCASLLRNIGCLDEAWAKVRPLVGAHHDPLIMALWSWAGVCGAGGAGTRVSSLAKCGASVRSRSC